jgi:hypothetical protein
MEIVYELCGVGINIRKPSTQIRPARRKGGVPRESGWPDGCVQFGDFVGSKPNGSRADVLDHVRHLESSNWKK